MKYIVMDLEATCDENRDSGLVKEIIEIGAVKVDEKGNILDSYDSFVRPSFSTTLTPFCTQLTSITQEQVDSARYLPDVVDEFKAWAGIDNNDYVLCSWGDYDRKQLIRDLSMRGINYNWVNRHFNIKAQYAAIHNMPRECGTVKALRKEGLSFDGTHHRGGDDAANIAKILIKYLGKWSLPPHTKQQ